MRVSKECLEVLELIERYCPEDKEKCEQEVARMRELCIVPKMKRKPSAFNLFMRDCLLNKRKENKEHKQKFKECVLEWKARK